jgi:hypothetical protein
MKGISEKPRYDAVAVVQNMEFAAWVDVCPRFHQRYKSLNITNPWYTHDEHIEDYNLDHSDLKVPREGLAAIQ